MTDLYAQRSQSPAWPILFSNDAAPSIPHPAVFKENAVPRIPIATSDDTLDAIPAHHPSPFHPTRTESGHTVVEEKAHNPRLKLYNIEAFIDIMRRLNLAHPMRIHTVLPANMACGRLKATESATPFVLKEIAADALRALAGQRSGRGRRLLTQLDFPSVTNLSGGMGFWRTQQEHPSC